jgi:hypothetical protein
VVGGLKRWRESASSLSWYRTQCGPQLFRLPSIHPMSCSWMRRLPRHADARVFLLSVCKLSDGPAHTGHGVTRACAVSSGRRRLLRYSCAGMAPLWGLLRHWVVDWAPRANVAVVTRDDEGHGGRYVPRYLARRQGELGAGTEWTCTWSWGGRERNREGLDKVYALDETPKPLGWERARAWSLHHVWL